jgi:hypothetical protein
MAIKKWFLRREYPKCPKSQKSLSPAGPDGVFLLIFDAGAGVDLTPGVKSRQNCPNLIPGARNTPRSFRHIGLIGIHLSMCGATYFCTLFDVAP